MPDLRNGVTMGKRFYFITISLILSGLVGIHLLISGKRGIKLSLTDILVIVYLGYVCLRLLFVSEVACDHILVVELFFMTVVYFVSKLLFAKAGEGPYKVLIIIFLLSAFYQAFLGLQQLYGYAPSHHNLFKVTGSFFNPAPYAGYLVAVFPMGLAIYHLTPSQSLPGRLFRYLALATSLTILLIIPATFSRASWIALVAGTLLIYVKRFELKNWITLHLNTAVKQIAVLSFAVILVGGLVFGLFYLKKESALGRLLAWEVTLHIIRDNPVWGTGYTTYNHVFGKYQAALFRSMEQVEDKAMVAGKGEYAFNELFLIAAEGGLIGLVVFLGIIFSAVRRPGTPKNVETALRSAISTGALGGITGLLVFSLFSYPFSITPLLLNFYFFLGILAASNDQKTLIHIRLNKISKYIFFAAIIATTIALTKSLPAKYLAMKTWKTASQLKRFGDYPAAIASMQNILPVLDQNGMFMFEYGQALTLNKSYEKGIEVLEKASKLVSDPYLYNSLGNCYQAVKNYKKAEASYLHAFYLIPHKFYPRYLLVKLYEEMGEREKAVALAQQVLTMKVKVPSTAINEIREEMEKVLNKENTYHEKAR